VQNGKIPVGAATCRPRAIWTAAVEFEQFHEVITIPHVEAECGGHKDWVYAKNIVTDLLPSFNYAYVVNEKSVEVVCAFAIFVAALLTPIVGDELVAGGSVAIAWASMAAITSSVPIDVMNFLENAKNIIGY